MTWTGRPSSEPASNGIERSYARGGGGGGCSSSMVATFSCTRHRASLVNCTEKRTGGLRISRPLATRCGPESVEQQPILQSKRDADPGSLPPWQFAPVVSELFSMGQLELNTGQQSGRAGGRKAKAGNRTKRRRTIPIVAHFNGFMSVVSISVARHRASRAAPVPPDLRLNESCGTPAS